MILTRLEELNYYLQKNDLTPPDKLKRKEIVNQIEEELASLIDRVDGFSDVKISRSYTDGLNFYLRFSEISMYIALEFRKNIVKCSLTAPLDTRLFYFDLNWRLNSKTLKELTKVSLSHNQSQVIFYESTLILEDNYENNFIFKLIELSDSLEKHLKEISKLRENLGLENFFYFDINKNLLVDIDEFDNLFNPVEQKINFSQENDRLFEELGKDKTNNHIKLSIAHLNMPLALKYIYPYKKQVTKTELLGMYSATIEAFLKCIEKYEATSSSFAYYVSTRLFANTSRYRSLIIRNRLENKYGDKPTFQQIDDYIKDHRNQNGDEYPLLSDIIKYFEPIIKDKLVNKEIKEKKDIESKYLKSSIPVLYNLITGKEIKYENRDIYETFMQELIKSFKYIFDKKEEFIITTRYLSDLESKNSSPITTLEEVGLALKITRERVRQIEKKALLKLQSVWKHVVPFEEKNIEFFQPISPPYSSRSREVNELVKTLESKGYFYKGMITEKLEIVEEIGKSLKIDSLALKKYINYLSENKTSQQKSPSTTEKNSYNLETELEDLDFSVRALNVFRENQISTLGQLISYSEEDLMYMTNFGNTTLNEVVKKLKNLGLELPHQSKGNETLKTNLSSLPPEVKIIYISLMDIGGKGTIKEIHTAVLKYQKDKPESSIRRALQQYSPGMKHYTGKHVFNQVSSGTYEIADIDTSGYFD